MVTRRKVVRGAKLITRIVMRVALAVTLIATGALVIWAFGDLIYEQIQDGTLLSGLLPVVAFFAILIGLGVLWEWAHS